MLSFILSELNFILNPGLVGINLPSVVDLNQKYLDLHPDAIGPLSKLQLSHVERATIVSGIVNMNLAMCGESHKNCSSIICGTISAGNFSGMTDVRQVRDIIDLPLLSSLTDLDLNRTRAPLLSVLALATGSLSAAKALMEIGVNFASVTNLAKPTCNVIETPEFTFQHIEAKKYWFKTRRQSLKEKISYFISEIESTDNINSTTLGIVPLSAENRRSLSTAAYRATNNIMRIANKQCELKVKIIAAACRSVKVHVKYGIDNEAYFEHDISFDEIILPNIAVPGECFSALMSCIGSSDGDAIPDLSIESDWD